MGISSPVLENVLFCHQEDSTWPLQEGAILKKKFDDIFESTRYSKALDAILKSKKEFNARAKDLKAEVAELGAQNQSANDMRDRLESCREREAICSRDLDGISSKIEDSERNVRLYLKISLVVLWINMFESMLITIGSCILIGRL